MYNYVNMNKLPKDIQIIIYKMIFNDTLKEVIEKSKMFLLSHTETMYAECIRCKNLRFSYPHKGFKCKTICKTCISLGDYQQYRFGWKYC